MKCLAQGHNDSLDWNPRSLDQESGTPPTEQMVLPYFFVYDVLLS